MNESDKTKEGEPPTHTNKDDPTNQGSATTISGNTESLENKKQATESNSKSTQSNATPPPMPERLKMVWLWVKDPKHSSAVQAIFTAVIMLTGILYTIFAGLQWSVMKSSSATSTNQLWSTINNLNWLARSMDTSAKAATEAATSAQNAIRQTRDQFRQDQRPYIWLTNAPAQIEFFANVGSNPPTGQIMWTYHYTNYGKSPAYSMLSYRFISTGVAQPYVESFISSDHVEQQRRISSITPPGKDDFSTVVSRPGFSREEFARLMGLDRGISIKLRFQYTDAYNGTYETGIHLIHLASGGILYGEDSYMKDGNK